MKALLASRMAEVGAILLALAGLGVLVALATHDGQDPSLNMATTRHAANLAGPGGAILSDLLLQSFGLAGALPGLAMLTWAWRIGSHRGIGGFPLRLFCLLLAMPLLATLLAAPTVGAAPASSGAAAPPARAAAASSRAVDARQLLDIITEVRENLRYKIEDGVVKFVTKDELAESCWPRRILSETVLTTTISRLRQALGEADAEAEA